MLEEADWDSMGEVGVDVEGEGRGEELVARRNGKRFERRVALEADFGSGCTLLPIEARGARGRARVTSGLDVERMSVGRPVESGRGARKEETKRKRKLVVPPLLEGRSELASAGIEPSKRRYGNWGRLDVQPSDVCERANPSSPPLPAGTSSAAGLFPTRLLVVFASAAPPWSGSIALPPACRLVVRSPLARC